MNQTRRMQSAAYEAVRSWLASSAGQAGLDRLEALGGSWGSTDGPHKIVAELGRLRGAPPLPKLLTFGDRLSFLAGVSWGMVLVSNLAQQMEER